MLRCEFDCDQVITVTHRSADVVLVNVNNGNIHTVPVYISLGPFHGMYVDNLHTL